MSSSGVIEAFTARRLFDGDSWLQDHALLVDGDHIAAVVPLAEVSMETPTTDLGDITLAPGLIDVQVNGGGGVMFNNDPSADGLATIAGAHRQYGTTTIMPTVISDTALVQQTAASAVRDAQAAGEHGVLGLHLEGPHFDPGRRGTHKADMIRPLTASDMDWLCSLQDYPTIVTLAPEHTTPGQVRRLSDAGLMVCAGHTNADYQQVSAAIEEGLRGFTHLFNAMSPLQSRAPGTVGAALDSPDTWAGIIADGHHVHPVGIRLAHRAKHTGKLILVSDAMSTVGGPDSFEIYGERIAVEDGRLINAEGNLAGSAIALIDAVRTAHKEAGLDLGECLRMASRYPAEFLDLGSRLGRLAAGFRADIFAFDQNFRVSDTWVAGEHQAHDAS
jgi:N-acetylglucosamine-6-phosphate deacetylase